VFYVDKIIFYLKLFTNFYEDHTYISSKPIISIPYNNILKLKVLSYHIAIVTIAWCNNGFKGISNRATTIRHLNGYYFLKKSDFKNGNFTQNQFLTKYIFLYSYKL